MSRGTREASDPWSRLRTPVVSGARLLLLGVLGVVVMVGCGEDRSTDDGSGQGPGLALTGLPDDMLETLQVSVKWREAGEETLVQRDARPVPGVPGTFRLPPEAYGRDVEIDVLKEGVIIVRKKLDWAGDSILRIDLLKEPAYREDGR